ncbi:tyrosine-protein kinase [Citrobacter amalonaticus]|uniref:Tyrosine-protein kinase n=1 Tax=Citrobacter amalonaticus TaxID=35703 RepID=A0A2S4RXL4_CITAM|nr:polysaccharide biosynthesis tyrosine autokinase [Citrobacter amalonaticus]POT56158.1 tyrosine-protein kinase [Citrobacter amalonaticus]POT74467.1 tyrosine-protein kinase [Citrobacter amalonaticus]POU65266.1 tyrosine-protein kinase [Citrobacter amalonaticus]POV04101.1 tyrosine-protein kinase [Citrobacter amalonaticus]
MSLITPSSAVTEPETIDLLSLFAELVRYWKLFLSGTILFLGFAVLYLLFSTPIYRADALIQVEQKQENALFSGLKEVLNDHQPSPASEIALLKSRMILGKAVDDLNLQNRVVPDWFTKMRITLSRLTGSASGVIDFSYLSLSKDNMHLILTVLDNTHYQIAGDGFILEGSAGKPLEGHGVSLLIRQIDAWKGSRFVISRVTHLAAIAALQQHFSITETGKNTGMLSLSLTGENPSQISGVLDSISHYYLKQNVERQSARDENSLLFLKRQLPVLRAELDEAEDRLSAYRQQNNSVDLSLETKSILEQIVDVDKQLNELTFREAEISRLYHKEHPVYRALLEKQNALQQEKSRLNGRISVMPVTQQTVLGLSRKVESERLVYQQLLNRQQELNISRAGAIGNVRIIDEAVTQAVPVSPKKLLIVIIGAMTGMIFSGGLILMFVAFRRGIESTEALEREGINVCASVPLSLTMVTHSRKNKAPVEGLLTTLMPADLAVEAIRSLRTNIYFAMMDAHNHVLMISGASPGAGKTFISSNLSHIVALTEKKVLFIDADLRKGYAHRLFGGTESPGLSDILAGRACLAQARVSLPEYGFDYIGRGPVPSNPTELLLHPRLAALLTEASSQYDLIIVDTPPVLAVTDAAIIGRYAGTVMMVVRYGVDTVQDITGSLKRLEQSGVMVKGCILNAVKRRAGDYYRYGHGQYDYSHLKD